MTRSRKPRPAGHPHAERDLEHAWKSGLVDLHVLYGPQPSSAISREMRVVRNDPADRNPREASS